MPSPQSGPDAVKELLKHFGELTEHLHNISTSVHELFRSFRTLGELANRAAFSLAAVVGIPRFVRGDLYHALTGHKKHSGAGVEGVPAEGTGRPAYKSNEQLMAEIRQRHALKMQLAKEEQAQQDAHWERINKKNADQARAARLADLAHSEHARKIAKPGFHQRETVKGAKPEFLRKAFAAVSYAKSQGMEVPAYRPHDAAYRQWVDAVHQMAQTAGLGYKPNAAYEGPAAQTKAAVGEAAASPAKNWWQKNVAPGKVIAARFGTAFATNSWSKGFTPGAAPVFSAINEAAGQVTRGFLGVAAAAQGVVQAASPDVWETFTGSIKLLAAVVGTSLVPFFMELAGATQELAWHLHELSPAQKQNLAEIMKWTLTIAGVAAAAGALTTALSALTSPIGLVIAGLGLLAAALNEKFNKPPEEKDKRPADQKTATLLNSDIVQGTLAEAGKLGIGDDQKQLNEFLKDKVADTMKEAARQHEIEGAAAEQLHKAGIDWPRPGNEWAPPLGLYTNTNFRTAVEASKHAGENETRASVLQEFLERRQGKPEPLTQDAKNTVMQFAAAFSSLRGTTQYMAVEQAYKRTQLSALGDDPLTALVRQIQLENLKDLGDKLGKMDSKLGDMLVGMAQAFGF